MSYIKVNIGGEDRGLKFNKMAMVMLSQKVDYNNYAATAVYALVYAGLYANEYVKSGGNVTDMASFADVCDWVDGLDNATIAAINNTFESTQAYRELVGADEKEIATKKKPMKPTKKI